MHIAFIPGLGQHNEFPILPAQASQTSLCFFATLSRVDWSSLQRYGALVQLWSNLPGNNGWHAVSFEVNQSDHHLSPPLNAALSLLPSTSIGNTAHVDLVSLKASVPISTSDGGDYAYTFRVVYPDGGIDWRGNGEGSNGTIRLSPLDEPLHIEDDKLWPDEASETRNLNINTQTSKVIAKLSQRVDWTGWVMTDDGPSSFKLSSSPPLPCSFLCVTPLPSEFITHDHQSYNSYLITAASQESKIVVHHDGGVSFSSGQVSIRSIQTTLLPSLFGLAASTSSPPVAKNSWAPLVLDVDNTKQPYLAHISPNLGGARLIVVTAIGEYSSQYSQIRIKSSSILEALERNEAVVFVPETNGCYFLANKESDLTLTVGPKGGTLIVSLAYYNANRSWFLAPLSGTSIRTVDDIKSPHNGAQHYNSEDPELMSTDSGPPRPEAGRMVHRASNPVYLSAAYIALLFTLMMAYISPAIRLRTQPQPSAPPPIAEKKRLNGPLQTTALASAGKDKARNGMGRKLPNGVVEFTLSSEGPAVLLVKTLGGSDITGITFKVDGKATQGQWTKLEGGVWKVEILYEKGSILRVE